MPYRRQIAEVEAQIAEVVAMVQDSRRLRKINSSTSRDKLLAQLARLNAKRTRLMMRQRLFERSNASTDSRSPVTPDHPKK